MSCSVNILFCLSRDIFTESTFQQTPHKRPRSPLKCAREENSPRLNSGCHADQEIVPSCCTALLHLRKGTYCRINDQPTSRCQKNRFKTLSLPRLGRESLLRSVDYNESVRMAFRVQEIMDKELFVALDTTEEALRRTCKVPSAMTLPRASLTNASRRKW